VPSGLAGWRPAARCCCRCARRRWRGERHHRRSPARQSQSPFRGYTIWPWPEPAGLSGRPRTEGCSDAPRTQNWLAASNCHHRSLAAEASGILGLCARAPRLNSVHPCNVARAHYAVKTAFNLCDSDLSRAAQVKMTNVLVGELPRREFLCLEFA